MLPRRLAVIDSQLAIVRTFERISSAPPPVGEGRPAPSPLRLAEKDYDRLFLNARELLEDLLHESRDIAADSRLKFLSEPGQQVARIDLLLAEIGPRENFVGS